MQPRKLQSSYEISSKSMDICKTAKYKQAIFDAKLFTFCFTVEINDCADASQKLFGRLLEDHNRLLQR